MFWRDGSLQPGAPPDRGLEFGDGLFETLAVVAGRPRLLDRHLARLARGAERLGLALPPSPALAAELGAAAAAPGTGVVKLIVTRGEGGIGYAPPAGAPRRYLWALPARERPGAPADGIAARWCRTRLAEQPALAGLKHLNRLEQVLARREPHDGTTAEGLMLDVHGRLVCGTMSNVFIVIGRELVTPSLARCGVEGVMRGALIEAFRAAGERVTERDVDPHELEGASELFVTNALIGAWPVVALEARRLAAGPWLRRAQSWIATW